MSDATPVISVEAVDRATAAVESLTRVELIRFYAAIHIAIARWEPRLRSLRAFYPKRSNGLARARDGRIGLRIRARYSPEALSGDLTSDAVDIDL